MMENWLSFKNAFKNIIDSQSDLSDIDKLHYLKSALVGEAASKVNLFTIDGVNYAEAWDVLVRAYEVKRLNHASLIFNFESTNVRPRDDLRSNSTSG